ncbi:MAG: hypothetical protein JNL21_35530 [Myxococcales bacterium]|nr:hypothetical protein [Myxococcales bacterium]
MDAPAFDDNGWRIGAVDPLASGCAFTLLSAEARGAFDRSKLAARAAAHGLEVELRPEKRYPAGTTPIADAADVSVAPRGAAARQSVLVVTFPAERARWLIDEALEVAARRGGAGMDALVRRARRIWQVRVTDDAKSALGVAAVLSAAHLAAILPPDAGPVFGPKTAFERLLAL